jgi:hypothetical protein
MDHKAIVINLLKLLDAEGPARKGDYHTQRGPADGSVFQKVWFTYDGSVNRLSRKSERIAIYAELKTRPLLLHFRSFIGSVNRPIVK